MLAHSRELLDQMLQTLSDRYALHRDGALSLGVAAEWCWDMDFHWYLLCLFDVRKSVFDAAKGRGQAGWASVCRLAGIQGHRPQRRRHRRSHAGEDEHIHLA